MSPMNEAHPALPPAIAEAASLLDGFVTQRTGRAPRASASEVLKDCLRFNPSGDSRDLPQVEAVAICARKWLARQLPAGVWRDPKEKAAAKALALRAAHRVLSGPSEAEN